MEHSRYHIDGWLTDYECCTDLEAVNDVIVFSSLLEGLSFATQAKVLLSTSGTREQLKTIEEVGLSDHKMVRYLPNDRWTSVNLKPEWIDLKDA